MKPAALTSSDYGDAPLGVESALPFFRTPAERISRVWVAMTVLLLALGGWQFGHGTYIYAKAQLAQLLVARAWERTLAGERQVKPWSWADTWPVARLTVPAMKIDLYVLAGASGRTIAFGPGHMTGTPLPGAIGNSVIGGHRDTHLAFLQRLATGQELIVQRADGRRLSYRVAGAEVVDKTDTGVIVADGETRLTLITCYPFNALRSGGRERYVVSARLAVPGRIAAMPPQMTSADIQNTTASPNRLPSPPNTSGMAN